MAYHDYERLLEAPREELALWKPSQQDSAEAVSAMTTVDQDYIRYHPTSTFANLAKSVPGVRGDFAMVNGGHDNLVLWAEVSALGIEALNGLIANAIVVMAGASQLSYAIDGLRPTLHVDTKVRTYQKPHCVPVCVSLMDDAPARKS